MNLKEKIRHVQDFPKPGIGFKDITTLIGDGVALREAIEQMKEHYKNEKIDKVVGIESRGYFFASILAYEWNTGLVPARKPGKLPAESISQTFDLEYGQDQLEMHVDSISPDDRVLIVDDLLATGGTIEATVKLVEKLKAKIVGCCFLVELDFLKGRDRLEYPVFSLVHYDSE